MTPRTLALLCCSVLAGCATVPCERVGGTRMLQYQLFFGRGDVSDRDWSDFTAQVVTPSLPDGFTALDGDGQWMNPATGQIVKERVKVILVAAPDTPVIAAAIARVKDEYRQRFRQISVGTTIGSACAAF